MFNELFKLDPKNTEHKIPIEATSQALKAYRCDMAGLSKTEIVDSYTRPGFQKELASHLKLLAVLSTWTFGSLFMAQRRCEENEDKQFPIMAFSKAGLESEYAKVCKSAFDSELGEEQLKLPLLYTNKDGKSEELGEIEVTRTEDSCNYYFWVDRNDERLLRIERKHLLMSFSFRLDGPNFIATEPYGACEVSNFHVRVV